MAKDKKKKVLEDGSLHVYSYHPVTGEFVGEDKAFADPLTPSNFLIPAYATEVEPPKAQNGKVRKWDGEKWKFEDAPQPDQKPSAEATTEQKAAAARYQRNMMLFQSDWRMLPDVPSKHKTEWEAYRQALRDLPAQEGFPESINWPTQP